jgi:arylformamidase
MKLKIVWLLICISIALTSVCQEEKAKKIKNGQEPSMKNVKYGPSERNVLNLWQAKSDKPTPVLIKIHGGGWTMGSKDEVLSPKDEYLAAGISVVSISYRLTDTDILPAPVYDAARALQFVRYTAKEWNLDKNRIALTGGSAGACSSLWLALHDDMADPKNEDPVLRESTKPTCIAVSAGQTCLDPEWIEKNIGPEANKHRMIFKSFGAKSAKEMTDNKDKYQKMIRDFSPIFHVDKNDPPMYLEYKEDISVPAKDPNHGIHHGMFGIKLKEEADKAGLECELSIKGYSEPKYSKPLLFIKAKFSEVKAQGEKEPDGQSSPKQLDK